MTYPNSTKDQVQTVILEKIRFKVAQVFTRKELNFRSHVDGWVDHISNGFTYQLTAEVLGERKKFPINIPTSWFQMFKKEYFPKWLLKKYPVQYQDLGILELYQLYPHIAASID